jgi:hypothetical protein
MADLTDNLDGSDFLGGNEAVATGEELESDHSAAFGHGLPDAAEPAAAPEATELVARTDSFAEL